MLMSEFVTFCENLIDLNMKLKNQRSFVNFDSNMLKNQATINYEGVDMES